MPTHSVGATYLQVALAKIKFAIYNGLTIDTDGSRSAESFVLD